MTLPNAVPTAPSDGWKFPLSVQKEMRRVYFERVPLWEREEQVHRWAKLYDVSVARIKAILGEDES